MVCLLKAVKEKTEEKKGKRGGRFRLSAADNGGRQWRRGSEKKNASDSGKKTKKNTADDGGTDKNKFESQSARSADGRAGMCAVPSSFFQFIIWCHWIRHRWDSKIFKFLFYRRSSHSGRNHHRDGTLVSNLNSLTSRMSSSATDGSRSIEFFKRIV